MASTGARMKPGQRVNISVRPACCPPSGRPLLLGCLGACSSHPTLLGHVQPSLPRPPAPASTPAPRGPSSWAGPAMGAPDRTSDPGGTVGNSWLPRGAGVAQREGTKDSQWGGRAGRAGEPAGSPRASPADGLPRSVCFVRLFQEPMFSCIHFADSISSSSVNPDFSAPAFMLPPSLELLKL